MLKRQSARGDHQMRVDGLNGMRERVDREGGTFVLDCASGHGFRFEARKLALHEVGSERTEVLSARELEVLRRLAQAQMVKEIAESMGLTPETVANHQSAIKRKPDGLR